MFAAWFSLSFKVNNPEKLGVGFSKGGGYACYFQGFIIGFIDWALKIGKIWDACNLPDLISFSLISFSRSVQFLRPVRADHFTITFPDGSWTL